MVCYDLNNEMVFDDVETMTAKGLELLEARGEKKNETAGETR
jgi:hypothetical protein